MVFPFLKDKYTKYFPFKKEKCGEYANFPILFRILQDTIL